MRGVRANKEEIVDKMGKGAHQRWRRSQKGRRERVLGEEGVQDGARVKARVTEEQTGWPSLPGCQSSDPNPVSPTSPPHAERHVCSDTLMSPHPEVSCCMGVRPEREGTSWGMGSTKGQTCRGTKDLYIHVLS